MATNLNVSDNQERVPLRVGGGGLNRAISPDDGNPYYVGARAYVTQTEDGATITVIDKEGTTTADIYNGQDGAAGQDGADGADGYSPSASVTKVGSTATITITDKDGTTTASISDGSGGGSAFVAEYNVTSYADVKAEYDNDAILICTTDDSGNPMILQFVYFDVANEIFYFAMPVSEGCLWTQLSNADGWDDGIFYFASTDVATQLADGLMSALDKQKLDGLSSGSVTDVEVDGTSVVTGSVASIDLTGKSDVGHTHTKSAITDFPTTVSSFTNDAGYITGYTETDPIFLASAAHGISSSDISNWNGKSDFSGSYNDLTDKPTIPTVNNATLTIQKNGSTVKTFTANASSNVTADITVPTKVSDLNNDSGFITLADLPIYNGGVS